MFIYIKDGKAMITLNARGITLNARSAQLGLAGKLIDLEGSPADGYSAKLIVDNVHVGNAYNYMDGQGWGLEIF